MSSQPPVIDIAPAQPTLEEKFEPIDPATYKWEWGKTVQVKIDMPSLWIKASFPKATSYDWAESEFTLKVDRPLTFQQLYDLVQNAVNQFAKDNEALKKESPDEQKVIIKSTFSKLFVYWMSELKKIKLLDLDSFKQATEKMQNNGHPTSHSG